MPRSLSALICALLMAGAVQAGDDDILPLPKIGQVEAQDSAESELSDPQRLALKRARRARSVRDEPQLVALFQQMVRDDPISLGNYVHWRPLESEHDWLDTYGKRLGLLDRPSPTRTHGAIVIGALIMYEPFVIDGEPRLIQLANDLRVAVQGRHILTLSANPMFGFTTRFDSLLGLSSRDSEVSLQLEAERDAQELIPSAFDRYEAVLESAESEQVEPQQGFAEAVSGPTKTWWLGSTEQEVRDAQGIPSSVSGGRWKYDHSTVVFRAGRVSYYMQVAGNLKVSAPNANISGTWSIGSTHDEVLSSQGTPETVRSGTRDSTWDYGRSSVSFEEGIVTGYDNRGDLRVR